MTKSHESNPPRQNVELVVTEDVLKEMSDYLRLGIFPSSKDFLARFHVSKDIFASPELRPAIREGLKLRFELYDIKDAIKMKEEYQIPDEIFLPEAINALKYRIEFGDVLRVGSIREASIIPEEIWFSPEIIDVVHVSIAALKQRIASLDLETEEETEGPLKAYHAETNQHFKTIMMEDAVLLSKMFHLPEPVFATSTK